MNEVGLELHPEKTKIVYCTDGKRSEDFPCISFDFLGYTFRPRKSKNWRGEFFINFNPVIQGWINYYGRFYRSALIPVLQCLNRGVLFGLLDLYSSGYTQ